MHSEVVALKKQLDHAYSRNRLPVAFIDESYRAESEGFPFYLVSAVVIDFIHVAKIRDLCHKISEESWWHTTAAYQNKWTEKIEGFLGLLAKDPITNVSSIQMEIPNNNLEHARRECLHQISKYLELLGCGLVVIEGRQSQSARRADTSVFSVAAGQNYISKHLKLIQSTPSVEQLLWLPDILSWSLRRFFAVNDARWISRLDGSVSLIDGSGSQYFKSQNVISEISSKKKRPQRAAAKSCDPEKPIDSENEGISRSSGLIMPQDFQTLQHFPQALGQVISPPIDPATLSAWLKSRFPK